MSHGTDQNVLHAAMCKLAVTVMNEDNHCAYCGLSRAFLRRGGKHEGFCPTFIAQDALSRATPTDPAMKGGTR
jgi:hypothetical protein